MAVNSWYPPGKNCGACGFKTCGRFAAAVSSGEKTNSDCVFFKENRLCAFSSPLTDASYSGVDVTGAAYDFVLSAFPGEPSARKIILPFRSDSVESKNILPGDIVVGRPAGAGCPIQHVIRVLDADPVTGVIEGHVIGPSAARGNASVLDLKMYHMIGFEGLAQEARLTPTFGKRYSFLPSFCMMHRAHSGLVNLAVSTPAGLRIRVEGVMVL